MTSSTSGNLVTCGELISSDTTFMRGHGTFLKNGGLHSSVSGVLERVNKLITVRPMRSRYSGEIGDVIIGRILEVGSKRWKLDVNSKQDGSLMLSSIHLPGAIQRRKSESDELQMRSFYSEGEIICAEVQTVYHDGGLSVHTRSLKYGKLVTGELLSVQPSLIKRSKSHFLVFSWNVEVILGVNGFVWVGIPRMSPHEQDLEAIYSNSLAELSSDEMQLMARTRNCILSLHHAFVNIEERTIVSTFQDSIDLDLADILSKDFIDSLRCKK